MSQPSLQDHKLAELRNALKFTKEVLLSLTCGGPREEMMLAAQYALLIVDTTKGHIVGTTGNGLRDAVLARLAKELLGVEFVLPDDIRKETNYP